MNFPVIFKDEWKESLRNNLYSVIASAVIAAIGLGYVSFYFSSIDPDLQARSKLTTQLANARKSLADAKRVSQESPDDLRLRLANAKVKLTDSSSYFLSDVQVTGIIDALYQYAAASGVTIADLQTQPNISPPTPTPTRPPLPSATPTQLIPTKSSGTPSPQSSVTLPPPSATRPSPTQPPPTPASSAAAQNDSYHITMLHLQVRGSTRQLVDFASRIKEASAKGFLVNNFNLTEGDGKPFLTMDIALYSAPNVSNAVVASAQPTPTVIPKPVAIQPPNSSGGVSSSPPIVNTAVAPSPTSMPPTATLPPPSATRVPATLTAIPSSPTSAPTKENPTVSTTKYVIYTVRPGDNMNAIARQYGTTLQAIMIANGMTGFDFYAGQRLRIPVP